MRVKRMTRKMMATRMRMMEKRGMKVTRRKLMT
jgi:hypothetical protein